TSVLFMTLSLFFSLTALIEPGTIAGIVSIDVLLTLIIVAVTYRCASFRHKKVENANKVYMNVRANCKKK
uniref:Hematopoietic cell signal transducer n=1 Tax=Oryzias latipes TaxID=8090 RepID=A0A3P9H1C9_ORYLA